MLVPTQPTNATCIINKCLRQHRRIDDTVNKGMAWKMPFAFAVADCVLNQGFIDQQWFAHEKLHILFAAIRY